jgi:hypothetical protein
MAAKKGFQILYLSNYAPTVRDYKNLKTNSKSRSGCLACKEKRVKVCISLDIPGVAMMEGLTVCSVTKYNLYVRDVKETTGLVSTVAALRHRQLQDREAQPPERPIACLS